LQKQVTGSYLRALDAQQRYEKVHNFRLLGTNYEDMIFVESHTQFEAATDVLESLTGCIEMKLEFPFEHLLIDCIVFAMVVVEQSEDLSKVDTVERLFSVYLSIPIAEVRERIIRRIFQRVRIVQAF